jgi:hypothetical protein
MTREKYIVWIPWYWQSDARFALLAMHDAIYETWREACEHIMSKSQDILSPNTTLGCHALTAYFLRGK